MAVAEDVFADDFAEDVFVDDFADDLANDSTEGLEAEQEGQPRALLSSPTLPNHKRSAEQALQGRGIPQVTSTSNHTDFSVSFNTVSPSCNDEIKIETTPRIETTSTIKIEIETLPRIEIEIVTLPRIEIEIETSPRIEIESEGTPKTKRVKRS